MVNFQVHCNITWDSNVNSIPIDNLRNYSFSVFLAAVVFADPWYLQSQRQERSTELWFITILSFVYVEKHKAALQRDTYTQIFKWALYDEIRSEKQILFPWLLFI